MLKLPIAAMCALSLASCSITPSTSEIQYSNNDLMTWQQLGNASWLIKGEVITTSGASSKGHLVSNQTFADLELSLEFKPDDKVNSGIFIRCRDKTKINADTCLELNIWDLHPKQEYRTGALVKHASPLAHVNTINKWNNYKIVAVGEHIKAWVNGVLVTDYKVPAYSESSGNIALQSFNGGRIEFRNITIKH